MTKIALMIFGPPGSGKGTQANLAAIKLDLIHFDTGKFLESIVHDPKKASDPDIKEKRRLFDKGFLIPTPWFLKMAKKKIVNIARTGTGIVMSGSPRTMEEAESLVPLLEKLYGKKYVYPVVLKARPATSMHRNSSRKVCSTCGMTILQTLMPHPEHLKFCPFCGAPLLRRTLDVPEVIKVRLKEYDEHTKPIFGFLKKRGYRVREINGEPLPHKVSQAIFKSIGYPPNK